MTKKLIPRKKRGGVLKGLDNLIVPPYNFKKGKIKVDNRNMIRTDKGWEDVGTELAQVSVTPNYTYTKPNPLSMDNITNLGAAEYYPQTGEYTQLFVEFSPESWEKYKKKHRTKNVVFNK